MRAVFSTGGSSSIYAKQAHEAHEHSAKHSLGDGHGVKAATEKGDGTQVLDVQGAATHLYKDVDAEIVESYNIGDLFLIRHTALHMPVRPCSARRHHSR